MSKKSKQRECPALGETITSMKCAENRVSRIACPSDCPHNPFAPQNYDRCAEIAHKVFTKCINWLHGDARDRAAIEGAFERALDAGSDQAIAALSAWHLFLRTAEDGLTCAERWERAGFGELNNDEQTVVRAKMRTRFVLLKIRRRTGSTSLEAVDLLSEDKSTMIVLDRRFAAKATDSGCYLTWTCPLPNYWTLRANPIAMPQVGSFEPAEVLAELVRQLGGPKDKSGLNRWFAEHFLQFETALAAVARAGLGEPAASDGGAGEDLATRLKRALATAPDDDSDETEPYSPPRTALTKEEAAARLDRVTEDFKTLDEVTLQFGANGFALMEQLRPLMLNSLCGDNRALFAAVLMRAWLALVPRHSPGPRHEIDDLMNAFNGEVENITNALESGDYMAFRRHVKAGRQPELTLLLANQIMKQGFEERKPSDRHAGELGVMIALLKAVIDETDRAVHRRF